MFVIKPYETAVSLFSANGEVEVFPSINAVRRKYSKYWIRKNVGPDFKEFLCISGLSQKMHYRHAEYQHWQYVMRDDFGSKLSADDIYPEVKRKPYDLYPLWNGEGPVPGLFKRSGRRYFRQPRTTQERRLSYPVFEDGEVAPRNSRNSRNLPHAWDDLVRNDNNQRNWKFYRRTRWIYILSNKTEPL